MTLGKMRNEQKYEAIQSFYEENQWSINWMCQQLKVTRAAYYKWLHREVPEQEQENKKIAELVREYDESFGHILGYRRMTDWINTFNQKDYNVKRIHRIMKKLNIHAVIRRKKKNYTHTDEETAAENLLKRDFNATKPNEKWTTDVTEFKIPQSDRKLYLSAILDLYDKSLISYVLAKRNDNKLVFDNFKDAISQYPDARPIFHSDRGFQYTSKVFQYMVQEQGMQQSMSRVGCCIDNGPTEGLWGIIKTEMYAMYEITDEASLIQAIHSYIEFYNNVRLQSRFGNKTPMQVREEALASENPTQYPIPKNKRIKKFKEKYAA